MASVFLTAPAKGNVTVTEKAFNLARDVIDCSQLAADGWTYKVNNYNAAKGTCSVVWTNSATNQKVTLNLTLTDKYSNLLFNALLERRIFANAETVLGDYEDYETETPEKPTLFTTNGSGYTINGSEENDFYTVYSGNQGAINTNGGDDSIAFGNDRPLSMKISKDEDDTLVSLDHFDLKVNHDSGYLLTFVGTDKADYVEVADELECNISYFTSGGDDTYMGGSNSFDAVCITSALNENSRLTLDGGTVSDHSNINVLYLPEQAVSMALDGNNNVVSLSVKQGKKDVAITGTTIKNFSMFVFGSQNDAMTVDGAANSSLNVFDEAGQDPLSLTSPDDKGLVWTVQDKDADGSTIDEIKTFDANQNKASDFVSDRTGLDDGAAITTTGVEVFYGSNAGNFIDATEYGRSRQKPDAGWRHWRRRVLWFLDESCGFLQWE